MSIRAVVLFTFVSVGVTVAQNEVCALDSGKSRDVTIKDVMVTAYKEKLAKKVMQGEATQDEKQRLLNLYEALAHSAPPRGSQVSWKRKTEALVNAAQAAVEGHENAPILLKRTMECGACHTSHK
jgi:surface antigen